MNTRHNRGFLAAIAVAIPAMLIGSGLPAPPAQAGYIVTLAQVGSDVIATGSGAIDLAGLSFVQTYSEQGAIQPDNGSITTAPASLTAYYIYNGTITGPTSFGIGGYTLANSGSGDLVAIAPAINDIGVPVGYVSGNPLSDNATYAGQTFSSLGVTPGTYEWTSGSGANQNFTLDAVLAPLIGRGLPVLLAVGGLLFGAKLLERGKRHRLQSG